jgi:hypothetical protein
MKCEYCSTEIGIGIFNDEKLMERIYNLRNEYLNNLNQMDEAK